MGTREDPLGRAVQFRAALQLPITEATAAEEEEEEEEYIDDVSSKKTIDFNYGLISLRNSHFPSSRHLLARRPRNVRICVINRNERRRLNQLVCALN